MFYSTTNQISTITGIQEDSIKEHSHTYDLTHNHPLSGVADYTNYYGNNNIQDDGSKLEALTSSGNGFNSLKFGDGVQGNNKNGSLRTIKGADIGSHYHTINLEDRKSDYWKNTSEKGIDGTFTELNNTATMTIGGRKNGAHWHPLPNLEIKIHQYSGTKSCNYTGTAETRPKNRLFRIWRRTL